MRRTVLLVTCLLALVACSTPEQIGERTGASQSLPAPAPIPQATTSQPPVTPPPAAANIATRTIIPPAPARQIFTDRLCAGPARLVGAALSGTALESPATTWSATAGVGFAATGATATLAGGGKGAHHLIPVIAGTIDVQADVIATGSGFTGIALGHGDLSGDFWKNSACIFFVRAGGYGLQMGTKNLVTNIDAKLLATSGSNHLELQVDTVARTLTARLNAKVVLDQAAIPVEVSTTTLNAAGFRFNEQVVAGSPVISNWKVEITSVATSGLIPVDHAMCFVEPDQEATLRWSSAVRGPRDQVPYTIGDYAGKQLAAGQVTLAADGSVALIRAFPRGYYEIAFPEAGQTFGIVSLESQRGPVDPFFCMDAGLSWLETDPLRRDALVRIIARCGIAMSRERLGLGAVNPSAGTYVWDKAPRAFETLRKTYAACGVPIMEMLHGSAQHHEPVKDTGYATNLPQLAISNLEQARHWGNSWGAVEIDNEPDLKTLPAEQYVCIAKTASYAQRLAGNSAPVVTGVFASIPPGPYFDTCAANGLLADSDVISFHSYDRAGSVEQMVARYRAWLAKASYAHLPLWHSECGWPWVKGPDRAPLNQDADSAVEIAAKAIESRACGIARYFPFVYTHYEEGPKCFGMMGREATPMRSMAAYAMAVRTLSGTHYLGDLTGITGPVTRARVFAADASGLRIAVLYAGAPVATASAHLPGPALRAAGADGRALPIIDGAISLADGMAYVWLDAAGTTAAINTDTAAAKLYAIAQQPLMQTRLASPVVLQFIAQKTPARASARRYLVDQETAHALPIHARLENLSSEAITAHPALTLPGGQPLQLAAVVIPAQGLVEVDWTVDASTALDIASTRLVTVTATVDAGTQPSALAIPLIIEGTLEQHLARHPHQRHLPFTDLSLWQKNCAEHGTSQLAVQDGIWRLSDSFSTTQGGWDYPLFTLAQAIDPATESGFLLRARISKASHAIALMANPNRSDSFWSTDLFPADGEWHVVYLPFAELKPGPNGAGMQNSRLDPAAWKILAIGMGGAKDNTYELSHFLVVGGSGGE